MNPRQFVLTLLVAFALLAGLSGPFDAAARPASPDAEWRLEGRVFSGSAGDESTPLDGVTVELYAANNPYPASSTFLRSTTTDATGWYGLTVYDTDYYEYFFLREVDPSGYVSTGASSVNGVVQEDNLIQYMIPLTGKTLTGNKFWDKRLLLSGRVYDGPVGDESHPLSDVLVSLTCTTEMNDIGTVVITTTTDAEGWYGLDLSSLIPGTLTAATNQSTDFTDPCQYYNILESDPYGYRSAGATSVSGTVRAVNWIQYHSPILEQTLTGNRFWDQVKPPPFTSVFPEAPPKIDGTATSSEWEGTPSLPLGHGRLHFQNDAANLYLLVDLTGDTQADPPLAYDPWGDYFWLTFDVDLNSAITPNVDLDYNTYPGTHSLGLQKYLAPGTWAGLSSTYSQLGAGFGPSPNSSSPHRIWEFAISLAEIQAAPNELVRLGMRNYSQSPSFKDDLPGNFFNDFSNLIEIALVGGQADLLVLADESFLSALEPLKTHKENTGIPTYVQSWQSLDKSFGGQGRDQPERLKHAIAAYQDCCGTHWVMLVGDVDKFPVRTVKATHTQWGGMYYPSDLYYADLYDETGSFDDWDSDADGIFGEMDFDGFGEKDLNKLNLDQIDMRPDVTVGRVPASSAAEVTTYVNKVIGYEFSAYQADWFQNALWVVDGGPAAFGDPAKKDRLDAYMSGFNILKRYLDESPWTGMTFDQRAAELNSLMNSGVGFINWFGHGNRKLWQDWYNDTKLSGMSNQNKLPVIYSLSCITGRYIWDGCDVTSQDLYQDASGSEWKYTACGTQTDRPQPKPIQASQYDRESFAEEFLVKRASGAVAYIGATSVYEYGGEDLDKYFFEAYSSSLKPPTLGYLWNYALNGWMDNVPLWSYYAFHHMHKVMLFGDPSLRVGGISSFQKSGLATTYDMVHDGWEGRLTLVAAPDDPIEQLPNLTGVYTGTNNLPHQVRGYMRTWQYPLPPEWGPDYKVEFHIDFGDTLQEEDDQPFDGYLFTQTRDAMAGVTWWNDTPFGFYALQDSTASSGLQFETSLEAIVKDDFTGIYQMNHDGWQGTLTLWSVTDDPIEQLPNLKGTYLGQDGKTHAVRGYVRTPSYPQPVEWGPDHKIALYIDFNDTPVWDDDQHFEGYLFTQTKDAMAGITWWHDRPFGFYALKTSVLTDVYVYLPFIKQ